MHLVQLLLPLADNQGRPFPAEAFARLRAELTERFGGVTAYLQSPAVGLWKEAPDEPVAADRVVLIEVMVDEVDRSWWAALRTRLEAEFRQDEVLLRALPVERL